MIATFSDLINALFWACIGGLLTLVAIIFGYSK